MQYIYGMVCYIMLHIIATSELTLKSTVHIEVYCLVKYKMELVLMILI